MTEEKTTTAGYCYICGSIKPPDPLPPTAHKPKEKVVRDCGGIKMIDPLPKGAILSKEPTKGGSDDAAQK